MNTENGKLKFYFPLERTHCGVVMGNGNFGAMVWGKQRLHVTVNRVDFWDHRGGELIVPGTAYRKLVETAQNRDYGKALEEAIPCYTFPDDVFKPQRLPVGRFEFVFVDGVVPVSAELEYESGTVTVSLSNGGSVALDLDLHKAALLVRDESVTIIRVTTKPAWDFPQSREWLERYAFVPPEGVEDKNRCGWIQSCPDDPSLACVCCKRHNGYAIVLELGTNNPAALHQVEKTLAEIDDVELRRRNRSWWHNYWVGIPEIVLPDQWFNRFFKYALYKFAAATHPNGRACGLQGPWHEEYQRAQWSGGYTTDLNVQQVYTLAFVTGKLEHLLPLFDMLESESFQHGMQHNAKILFGIDDGLWMTCSLDDRGFQAGWLHPGTILSPACAIWTAQLYWLYYRYSLDREFLQSRALPFMRGVMRGIEEMLEEYNGRLSIPLAVSDEYGFGNPNKIHAGRDPSYQLAAVHMLADCLIETAQILEFSPEPVWLDIKQRLPQYTTIKGEDPRTGEIETRIAIWEGQDLEVCHRHHSHLAAIYPFETLGNPTPEQAELIDNTIDQWVLKGMGQWSEWCMPWAAIIYSRLGFSESPMILFNLWKEIFINEGLATVYLPRSRGIIAHRRHDLKKPKETSEIMQLDGTMGAATALLEAMAHQRGDTVYLFQGIPEKWREVSFKNIHLPGGFSISAERQRSVMVTSRFGGEMKLAMEGRVETLRFQPGESKTIVVKSFVPISEVENWATRDNKR